LTNSVYTLAIYTNDNSAFGQKDSILLALIFFFSNYL